MASPSGFIAVRRAVIASLISGSYQFESRTDIEIKNLLASGDVTPETLIGVLSRCNGSDHTRSPHHRIAGSPDRRIAGSPDRRIAGILVHVIRTGGWYLKFYFMEPDTWFISVHL